VRRLAKLCNAEIAIPNHAGALRSKFLGDPTGFLVRAVTALREGLRARMWTMYFNPKRGRSSRKKPKYVGKKGLMKLSRGQKHRHRLAGNETLPGFDEWQVLHTPGHSWDSCCFYHEASGSLLSGDTLLGSAKQNRVVVPSIYANAKQTEESLAMLRKLQIKAVYPGHGSVISGELSF